MSEKTRIFNFRKIRYILSALPSVIAALVASSPILTCPACWPLYAGLLSSLGIGFVNYTPYILPSTIVMIIVALLPIGLRAYKTHTYKPLICGLMASAILLSGKFFMDNEYIFYSGALLLIISSLWNIWPKLAGGSNDCPACK